MKGCDSGVGGELILGERGGVAEDDFSPKVKGALAKRAAFQCSLCKAPTIGPSRESSSAVTNVGCAAHIAGARPGSARYDATMKPAQRSSIENGIWLCRTHGTQIDEDEATWTPDRLLKAKEAHEEAMLAAIGVPRQHIGLVTVEGKATEKQSPGFGFLRVGAMLPACRAFLGPMLADKGLGEADELGVLMTHLRGGVPWTVFVRPDWLRGAIAGRPEINADREIPASAIHGRVPAWPDEFLEFLEAIVQTGATFRWQRTPQGYLALAQ